MPAFALSGRDALEEELARFGAHWAVRFAPPDDRRVEAAPAGAGRLSRSPLKDEFVAGRSEPAVREAGGRNADDPAEPRLLSPVARERVAAGAVSVLLDGLRRLLDAARAPSAEFGENRLVVGARNMELDPLERGAA